MLCLSQCWKTHLRAPLLLPVLLQEAGRKSGAGCRRGTGGVFSFFLSSILLILDPPPLHFPCELTHE